MNKIQSVIWSMDPHTEAKHTILKKYLQAWIPIISRYNGKVIYIDGFAGPGEYKNGKDGSPIIAIKSVIEHKLRNQMRAHFKFLFIEKKKDRCEHLKKILSKIKLPLSPKIDITIECNKFHEVIGDILNSLEDKNKSLAPSFVFIDPFGFSGIPLDLIKKIMKNKRCEVLITFMYEDIIRWLELPLNAPHLDALFGTNKWRLINKKCSNPKDKVIRFHNLYQSQLKGDIGINYVRSFMMVNKFNKPDYFLFFGTNNKLGLEKMKESMWKVDKFGSFQFSDATYDPEQSVLFEPSPKFSILKREILNKYKGEKVAIEQLEDFVLLETAFIKSHIRRPILDKMEHSDPPEILVYYDKARRRGSYPEGTVIEFL